VSSYTGHPDDVALERQIEAAALELITASTPAKRRAAWDLMKRLHAKRSPREIAAREQHIRERARV